MIKATREIDDYLKETVKFLSQREYEEILYGEEGDSEWKNEKDLAEDLWLKE